MGRLGDMYGRVRIYNLGFVVFTLASIALSLDPLTGSGGALWLIGCRLVQALGGAMLDVQLGRDPDRRVPGQGKRGMALGVNQIAGISGQFVGLLLGGLLAAVDWRLVFWVNVPIGIVGTDLVLPQPARDRHHPPGPDRLVRATSRSAWAPPRCWSRSPTGSSPTAGHPTGWTNPWVLTGLFGGAALLVVFCLIETHIADPMFQLRLFRIRAFAPGTWPACSARSPAAGCSSCWCCGSPASGCRCTATTSSTPRCGRASTCCR